MNLEAQSGPEGENPTGHYTVTTITGDCPDPGVSEHCEGFAFQFSGFVGCLGVSGNMAVIAADTFVPFFSLRIGVIDNGSPGAGRDVIAVSGFGPFPVPTGPPCRGLPVGGDPTPGGEITVIDAQPLPTTKDQCTNGGWA